jgi:hypothetical protein
MKSAVKVFVMLLLATVIASPAGAQEEKAVKKAEKAAKAEKKAAEKGQKAKAAVAAGLMKKLEQAGLSDEQKAQVKEIVAKYEPQLADASKKLATVGPEQKKIAAAARKQAQGEGKKGKELQAAVQASLKLTAEQ